MAGIVLVSIVQWKGYLDNELMIIGGLCLGLVILSHRNREYYLNGKPAP